MTATATQTQPKPQTKKARTAEFRQKLATDKRWAIRGMLRIFAEQTRAEQDAESTQDWNGRGFNSNDAELLTSFSKQVQRGWNLTDGQMAWVFKKMPKYGAQLVRLVDEAREAEEGA